MIQRLPPVWFRVLGFLAGLSVVQWTHAAEEVKSAPVPDWVEAIEIPEASEEAEKASNEGVVYLLADTQQNELNQTRFERYARKFISHSGVQENSRIGFDFEPSYQTATLNRLVIHRNGQTLDRLDSAKIRLLKRETDLGQHLYNGHVTAVVDVDDIRVGDVLEYAFSVQGANPVFNGVFGDFIMTSWPSPVSRFSYLLRWPKDRYLGIRCSGKTPEPQKNSGPDFDEYRWHAENIPAVEMETDIPSWVSPFDWIQLSGYRNWAEVEAWAQAFYSVDNPLPPDVEARLSKLRSLSSPEARITGALEYVQDQIRYLSISEGVHAYRPYPIEEVIQRGFGDCKDKARLLSTMLRELGFTAYPALVQTAYRGEIGKWLPSPLDFDHVIVALTYDGQTYWLDPTRDHQRGPLASRFLPDYGKALVIREGETALTEVRPMGYAAASMHLDTRFEIPDYQGPAKLTIRSIYQGREADSMRYLLASNSRAQLQKNYLNDTTRLYPGVENTGDVTFQDEPDKNEITSHEPYTVPKLWQPRNSDEANLYAEVYPSAIDAETKLPTTRIRTAPIAVNHPKDIRETFTFELPEPGNFPNESVEVKDPAFTFSYQVQKTGKFLNIDFRYQSLAAEVPVERIPEYLANLKKVRDQLGYSITVPKARTEGAPAELAASGDLNWMLIVIVLLLSLVLIGCAWWVLRWRPAWPPEPAHPDFNGLRGWLFLVAFGLLCRPFFMAFGLVDFLHLFRMDSWNQFVQPSGAYYHSLWVPVFLGELLINLSLLTLALVLLVLFFQRRRTFPFFFILFLAACAGFSLLDVAATYPLAQKFPDLGLTENSKVVFQTLLQAALWIPYALISQRVKATFIR